MISILILNSKISIQNAGFELDECNPRIEDIFLIFNPLSSTLLSLHDFAGTSQGAHRFYASEVAYRPDSLICHTFVSSSRLNALKSQ